MFFCTVVALVFSIFGASEIVEQQYKLRWYKPVEAKLTGVTIDEHGWGRGKGYEPKITYAYTVNGKSYTSNNVVVIDKKRGLAEAEEIISKFRFNMPCTAYYNPSNPAKAFLYWEVMFSPTFFTLFSWTMTLFGTLLYLKHRTWESTPRKASRFDEQWYQVENYERLQKVRLGVLACVLYILVSIGISLPYFSLVKQPYESGQLFCAGCTLLLGIGFIGYFVMTRIRWLMQPGIELLITEPELITGHALNFKLTTYFKKRSALHKIEVRLICLKYREEIEQWGRHIKFRAFGDELNYYHKVLSQDQELLAGERLNISDVIKVPTGVHESEVSSGDREHLYKWMFKIEALINNKKCRWEFPVRCTSPKESRHHVLH